MQIPPSVPEEEMNHLRSSSRFSAHHPAHPAHFGGQIPSPMGGGMGHEQQPFPVNGIEV
jgi:hypothetical protein